MSKKRISLTLDEEVVREIDKRMGDNSRSHVIENMLRSSLKREKIKLALILAGGDYKNQIPDPLITVNEKPVIFHLLQHLRYQGIEKVLIAVGDKHEQIISKVGKGDKFGLDIDYVMEGEPLGTAGCLQLAQEYFQSTFLMMNGDVLAQVDIEDMLKTHRENSNPATIALTTVEDPEPYGVVRLKGQSVVGFQDQGKSDIKSNLVNAGVYILEPSVIDMLPEGDKVNIEQLFEELASQSNLTGYVYSGEWSDIGV